jgi:uncharacterized glyoxalase superfamily protein PhnB
MISLGPVTPVLRIFDERKAREFYVEFLDFKIDFEHRFGDNFPIYIGLSRGGCVLHLTEHHGDASPGAHVRLQTDNVALICDQMALKNYKFSKPGGSEKTPWGTREVTVTDPFGNKLTFHQLEPA